MYNGNQTYPFEKDSISIPLGVIFNLLIMFLSECLNDKDCSAIDNKNTCNKNVCQCNGGYIPDQDGCKRCEANEISVQNPETLTFSCVACPSSEAPTEDRQRCEGMLNNRNCFSSILKSVDQRLKTRIRQF